MKQGDIHLVLCVSGVQSDLDLINYYLTDGGYLISNAKTAHEALISVGNGFVSLIIMDSDLPDMGGFELLKQLKANPATTHIPIIILTNRDEEAVKVMALELGADDYITKPFYGGELVARVKSILKYIIIERKFPPILVNGPLTVDREKQEAFLNSERLQLEMREFQLLCELMKNMGHILSAEQLAVRIWGYDYFYADTAAIVHIKRLKKKLKEYGHLIRSINKDRFQMVAYSVENQ